MVIFLCPIVTSVKAPLGGIAMRRVCWLVCLFIRWCVHSSLVFSLVCSSVSSHLATGCNGRQAGVL